MCIGYSSLIDDCNLDDPDTGKFRQDQGYSSAI